MNHYFGNYPNSANYDPNIPIGYNKWDDTDYSDEPRPLREEESIEEWEDDGYDYPEENTVTIPNHGNMGVSNDEKVNDDKRG